MGPLLLFLPPHLRETVPRFRGLLPPGSAMHRRRFDPMSYLAPLAGAVLLALFAVGMVTAWARADNGTKVAAPPVLPAMHAQAALKVDTQFIGGYAKGTFVAALGTVAGDL